MTFQIFLELLSDFNMTLLYLLIYIYIYINISIDILYNVISYKIKTPNTYTTLIKYANIKKKC